MKWVERAGLVKFDFLGLKTLTVLEKAVELLKGTGVDIDVNNLPLDDRRLLSFWGAATQLACSSWKVPACAMLRKDETGCF
ncbi:MAG: hypothetical protein CM15mP21_3270 [Hyphomicrobiales bacterium]|nr:MAG: hypothetical protein CM15mP21_3270 [Hyphomicrobiales bacterium]